jgi:predicted adenylyl cyclase CyaB
MGGTGQLRANLEIKARCADLEAVRARVEVIATEHVGVDHQIDTYFVTARGRLKLRESSLSGGQLVPYLRPDLQGPRRSDYRVIPVEDPAGLKGLLATILGIHCVVDKEREIFLYENVRIHLDRVKGLGTFLELEAVFDGSPAAEADQHLKVDWLMKELRVEPGDLLAASYEALVDGG